MPYQVKGGILKLHDATKRTPTQTTAEQRKARLVALRAKGVARLTPAEKNEIIDAMLTQWLESATK